MRTNCKVAWASAYDTSASGRVIRVSTPSFVITSQSVVIRETTVISSLLLHRD